MFRLVAYSFLSFARLFSVILPLFITVLIATFSTSAQAAPDIHVSVLGIANVVDGDAAPTLAKGTDFGITDLASGVATRTISISNTGDETLLMPSGAILSGTHASDFSIDSQPSNSITRFQNTRFTVSFNPSATGIRTAILTIPNNDPDEGPFDFVIQGTGSTSAPEISITGNNVEILHNSNTFSTFNNTDFGVVSNNGVTVDKTFVIRNLGTATLNLGVDAVSVASAFTVISQPSSTVLPGQTTSFTMRYTSQQGTSSTFVTVANDDGDEGPFRFRVVGAGSGSLPEINVLRGATTIADDPANDPSASSATNFDVSVNDSVTKIYTIENTGTDTLNLGANAVSITGTDAGHYSVPLQPTTTVAPGGTATFHIQFSPNAPRMFGPANIVIANDDSDESPYNFRVQGIGRALEINLTGNGQNIADDTNHAPILGDHTDFGSADINGGSVTRTFTIENNGFGFFLDLQSTSAVTLSGPNASDFTVSRQPPQLVDAGVPETFEITFDPSGAGLRGPVNVSITNDDLDENPYNFRIQGTGAVAPEINVEGNSVTIGSGDTTPDLTDHTDFGTQDIDSGSISRSYRIRNTGTSTLTLGSDAVSISGANASDFSIISQPSTSINSGNSRSFNIGFNPSALGLRTANISIANDDSDESPYTFAIAGTGGGDPEIAITGNGRNINSDPFGSLPSVSRDTDFGQIPITGGTDTHTFTITNSGNAPLMFTGTPRVVISGTHAGDYSLVSDAASTVAANGGTTTFSIQFDPSVYGDRNAIITIANNDANEGGFNFQITGEGVGPEIQVSGGGVLSVDQIITDGDTTPSSADHTDFGVTDVAAGTASRTFLITNLGEEALSLPSGASLSGPNAADFTIVSQPAASVDPGGFYNTKVIVEFDPSAVGTRTATLTIPNNDLDEAPFDFVLQGTGSNAAPEISVTGNGQDVPYNTSFSINLVSTANGSHFGTVANNGIIVERTFIIENKGTASLNLGNDAVSIVGSTVFSIPVQPASAVLPGQTTSFTIRFTSQNGGFAASAKINNDDMDEGPYYFPIYGAGGVSLPEINVVGNSVNIVDGDTVPSTADHTNFGSTNVISGTISRMFTIQNTGTGTLNVTNAVLSGADAGEFSITTAPSNTIAPSGSSTVVVQFDPSSAGVKSATLTISSDDGNESEYDFALTGNGIGNSEINVVGNSINIVDGDTTPDTADHTDFGSTNITSGRISRTFTIQNTGTATLNVTNAVLSGVNASEFTITTAPANTIAPSGSSMVVVQFDPSSVGPKSATLTINSDDSNEAAYDFAIEGNGIGTGSISLVVNSQGGDAAFGFSSPTPALTLTVSTVSGVGQSPSIDLAPGTYIVTANDMTGAGYAIIAIACNDSNSVGDITNHSATINLAAGEAVICTFDFLETREATGQLITDFLGARNTLILSNQPSRSRRVDRLKSNDGGASSGAVSALGFNLTNPVPIDVSLDGNILSYTTSLNRLKQVNKPLNQLNGTSFQVNRWDTWIEGQTTLYDAPTDDGSFSIAHVGVDYLLSPNALIGIKGQYDWTNHNFATPNAKASGTGWMIGPYGTFKLSDELIFDIHGAWGKSTNNITPFGTYTDTFETSRWLVSGALTGNFTFDEWTISPGLEWGYLSETQKAYKDNFNIEIPSRTVSLGNISFGPKISKDFALSDDSILTFSSYLEGVYSYAPNNQFSGGTLAKETKGFTGTFGAGVDIKSTSGASLSFSGNVGGVGSKSKTYSAAVKLSIPLD
ncbi:choice-of-anchor D domain-containing protein [Lentilitoribacter sp. EG35]|uniref:choice-of-anchor D domain-containing protein n=1 Tax=Lentilitoribacter sp. EG35 TaxID=3234192 RepID=UPI00345FD3EB